MAIIPVGSTTIPAGTKAIPVGRTTVPAGSEVISVGMMAVPHRLVMPPCPSDIPPT